MTQEYLNFIREHGISGLTETESELLQFLVKHKIGGFEAIVKLYRDCSAKHQNKSTSL